MAIAGVGSVAASLSEGLTREGRTLLGGDVAFSLIQREAKPEEIAFLRARGQVSVAAALRVMARSGDGKLALVELKAVDGNYPMLGRADARSQNADGGSAGRARRRVRRGGRFHPAGAARSQARRPHHASATPRSRSAAWSRPSRTSSPAMSGWARAFWSARPSLRATGLLQPGSLVRWIYRVKLPDNAADDRAATAADRQRAQRPAARPAGGSAAAAMPRRSSSAPSTASPSS